MPPADALPDLAAIAREARPEELPALLGKVVEAEAVVRLRLATFGPTPTGNHTEPERWITAQEAAKIAGVKSKRIYEWARGRPWASRPTKRCLRVYETRFRAWLASQAT